MIFLIVYMHLLVIYKYYFHNHILNNVFYFDKWLWHYWIMINKTNYKDFSHSDLMTKLRKLSETREDEELRNKIYIHIQNLNQNENQVNKLTQTSTSVENTLDVLGTIIIILGVIGGVIFVGVGLSEENVFSISFGITGILSSLVSGYLLKGIAKIITLLSQNVPSSSNQNIQVDNKKTDKNSSSEFLDENFLDEQIDKRSLSELRNKFDELNSMNWNNMTKAQKDLREKLVKKIQSSQNS